VKFFFDFAFRNYVIEKRKTSSGRPWERASGCVPSDVTQFKVARLDEGDSYLFQVRAENDQGCGPALTTDFEIVAKNPFGQLLLVSYLFTGWAELNYSTYIIDCNLQTECRIVIIFCANIPDTTVYQKTVQVFTTFIAFVCTIWKETKHAKYTLKWTQNVKNISDIIDCAMTYDDQILIVFSWTISDTAGH